MAVAHSSEKQPRRILRVSIMPLTIVTEAEKKGVYDAFVHLRTQRMNAFRAENFEIRG